MYSSLKRLEKDVHITSYWGDESQGGRRRYYHITRSGRELYESNKQNWDYAKKILDKLL
jgi:PadR family transcriptional regulator PadR